MFLEVISSEEKSLKLSAQIMFFFVRISLLIFEDFCSAPVVLRVEDLLTPFGVSAHFMSK